MLAGSGFVVEDAEAHILISADERNKDILRPYIKGKELLTAPQNRWVIDYGLRSREEAQGYSILYDLVRDRVKPERDANKDKLRRERWWVFGRTNENLRKALAGLNRYIATVETAKHRTFVFLSHQIAPDHKIVAIASDEANHLGVLSSQLHVIWAAAAGSRHGVGNDLVYNKSTCFDAFPFPDASVISRERIVSVVNRLDRHRTAALLRSEAVSLTGMYNVVEKLRSGAALTPKERTIHELAACGVLRDLHDELDALVAEAYGWPWPMEKEEILERLVALHDERVEEENRGVVRWLRPDYQIPRFGADLPAATLDLPASASPIPAPAELRAWPLSAVEQLTAIGTLVSSRAVSADEAAASFTGARRDLVVRHLDTLALMGEVVRDADGRYQAARKVA